MNIVQALNTGISKLKPIVNKILDEDVSLIIKLTEQNAIIKEVYESYTPLLYDRREMNGGLADIQNIKHYVKDGSLVVKNVTPANPYKGTTNKNLPMLIEYGDGVHGNFYDYRRKGRDYMKPRPFTATTISMLESNKDHITALKQGLRDHKIKVM